MDVDENKCWLSFVGVCVRDVTVMSYEGNVPSLKAVLPTPCRTTVIAVPAVLTVYVLFALFGNAVAAKSANPVASSVRPTNEFPPPPSVVGLAYYCCALAAKVVKSAITALRF
jgi:hypothetical protein